jgi:type II secretory pathway pseudopilin PulG
VRRKIELVVVLALLLAGWVAVAFTTSAGTDAHAFRTAAAKTAQGALSAVRTAHLAGQARLDGRMFDTTLSPVLDNAVQGVATAQEELAATPAPGPAEAAIRDQLTGLLQDAARTVGDLAAAFDRGDDGAARSAVGGLGPLGDRLADFVEGHRP